jgi:1,2-dihydroxy-3-keto-5-methylthiopentene dioxygenase
MAIVSVPKQDLKMTEPVQIKEYLSKIGIDYDQWEIVELAEDADDQTVLDAYAEKINRIKQSGGYTSVDLVNVHSTTPGLDEMLSKFNREHWHDEDELRFVVQGRGLFHIHPLDWPVVAIEVGAGDMIRVPQGTCHWFNLCGSRQIKAIRFFQNKSGWTPYYSGSMEEREYQPVCFGPAYLSPRV